MKKLLILSLIIVSVTTGVQAEEDLLFEQNDPAGDEYGPGTYLYPTSEQFSPYQGLFDLIEYRVTRSDDRYNFYFKFVEVTNPWNSPYGFSHQLIQVYIDNQSGGRCQTFKPGARVRFEEQHPWDRLLKVTGWRVEVYSAGDQSEADGWVEKADVALEEQTIKVSLDREELGRLKDAHYYVLIGSLDGFGHDNYREVAAEPGGWQFGGGTDTEYNPNVLDTLVPAGMTQKEILGGYSVEADKLAMLRAVGPELSLPFKFIIIIGFLVVLFSSLVGVAVKFIRRRDS